MKRRLGLCALVLIALGACGSPPNDRSVQRADPETVPPLLAQAAAATKAAGAARVVSHGTMLMAGMSKPMKTSSFGVVSGTRTRLFMDLGRSPLTGDMGTAQIIGIGTMMYMKSTFFESLMPPDTKPWLKFDLGAIGEEMGMDFNALVQLGRDPTQNMDFLWGAEDVETVGHPTLYGVRTTHFRGVVDFRSAADQAPKEIRDRLAATLDQLVELTGVETAPMEVWVDDAGLIRRMKFSMDLTEAPPSGSVPQMKMTETMDFVKYGIDAKITVPPASKVTDVLEYIEANGGSAAF